jgi:predicted nucleotidyltransferase
LQIRPYYPASDLLRLTRDDGLQVDFMATVHGIRSYEGVRDRAQRIELGDVSMLVATLEDVIRSKRAARRPRDLAVIEILEKSLEEARHKTRKAGRSRPRE